ncbi:MAG: ABC transporter permease [Anaerolineae bacterium]
MSLGGGRHRGERSADGVAGRPNSTTVVSRATAVVAGLPGRSGHWALAWLRQALPWLVRLTSIGALLAAWEVYGRLQETRLFFAPLSEVVMALWDLAQTREFWSAYQDTLTPFLYGWALAMVLGIPLGLLIGRFAAIARISNPYLAFLNALPISTLVPVVFIGWSQIGSGLGIEARTTVVFLFAVVEIILNTAAGVRYVSRELMEMGRSFGASQWQLFRRIILPGSLPGIMVGARIGTGRAVVGMVVVEVLLVAVGVGRLIDRYRSRFLAPELFAVVLSLAIFGIVLLEIVRRVERRVLRWRPEA